MAALGVQHERGRAREQQPDSSASHHQSWYNDDCMKPIPVEQQQSLVSRLMKACGGAYSPEIRRKYFISGPQWAAAYDGSALFHAPTRPSIGFEDVIRKYAEIGIGYWCTHDTDVIPTEALGKDAQWEIVDRIRKALAG